MITDDGELKDYMVREKRYEYIEEFRKIADPLNYEILMVVYLTKNLEEVGSIWLTDKNNYINIPTRKLLSPIIQNESIYYILVYHNHINGRNALPSEADMNIVSVLNFCCEFLDAKLLDFIITDEDGSLSCITRLYIENMENKE